MFKKTIFHFLVMIMLLLTTSANGKSHIKKAKIYQNEQTLFVDINSHISFPESVKEAIYSGIVLKFMYEFEIKDMAWYKIKPIAKINKVYNLSYQRITDKYTISNPITYEREEFSTLYEAKQFMQKLQNFPLILINQIVDKKTVLAVRFHLSNDNFPSYVRVERMFNTNWSVDSDWSYWQLP